jgi:hypothetical protein
MSCPKCGSALAAGAAACPVCDPWAAPLRPVTALPALTPIPVQAKLPTWIRRTAGRNRPAYADLEKAWRNSVIIGSLTVVLMTFAQAAVAAGLFAHSPGLSAACVGVAVLALLGMLGVLAVVRRNFWLGRAIAVVGTRPDIGYEGFARIRGIVWITRTVRAFPVLIIAFGCLNVFLVSNSTLTALNISYGVYMFLLACMCALQYLFQASAHRDLARLLSR